MTDTRDLSLVAVLSMCHEYRVRQFRDGDVVITFADDAFMVADAPAVPPDAEPDDKELTR